MKRNSFDDGSQSYSLSNIPLKINPLRDDFDTFVPRLMESSFILEKTSHIYEKEAIQAQNVNFSKWSKNKLVQILRSTNMTVPVGVIYSLLGPSACGKTTLLRTLIGCIKPNSGIIRVFGFKPGSNVTNIPGLGIGYMPQNLSLYSDLTIEEMLIYFGRIYYINDNILQQRIDNLVNVMDLPKKTQIIFKLSEGQKRRVSFACSLIHKPKLLILDEPTVGVDPILRHRIWKILKNLTEKEKTTIIITTHYIEETKASNLVGFMRKGQILIEDKPSSIIQKYEVQSLEQAFYLLCLDQKKRVKNLNSKSNKQGFNFFENYKETEIQNIFTDHLTSKSKKYMSHWIIKVDAITRKIITQTFRKPSFLFAQYILPIISLSLFCMCIGRTPQKLPLGIVNEEISSSVNDEYLNRINSSLLQMKHFSNLYLALEAVHRLEILGVIYIRSNFSHNLLCRLTTFGDKLEDDSIERGTIRFYADLTNKVLTLTVLRTLNEALQEMIPELLRSKGFKSNIFTAPIVLERAIYGEYKKGDYYAIRDYGIPGTLIILTYTVAFGLTILILLDETKDQVLERNYVAGVSSTQIIFGHLIAQSIFTFFNLINLLLIAVFAFDVASRGPLIYSFILLLMQSLTGLTHGMLLSSFAPQMFSAAVLGNAVLLTIFIISGILWPFEALPYWIRPISYIQPSTIPTESIRSILARGLSITHPSVYLGFLVSGIWAFVFLFAAIFVFSRIITA